MLPFVAGALLAAVVFEILLRNIDWIQTTATGSTVVIQRLNEGWGISHWDPRGVRATAAVDSPGGVPVLLAVGDSFTQGLQVDDDEVFTDRIQTLTGARVLNAGRSSESPADYCFSAAERLKQFRPAWTVIELNASDLSDDAFNPSKTHFVRRDGHLVAEQAPPVHLGRISRVLAVLRHHSALANYGIARIDMYRSSSRSPRLFHAGDVEPSAPQPAPQPPGPVEEELSLMSAAYGGRVTFFFIPKFEAAKAPEEMRFLAYCRAAHLSCADLRAAFGEFSAAGRAPFGFLNSRFGDGHLNPAGHRAAASVLAAELSNVRRRGFF